MDQAELQGDGMEEVEGARPACHLLGGGTVGF